MHPKKLLKNLRFYVLFSSTLFAIVIYLYTALTNPVLESRATNLAQVYGLLSLIYLYLTLLISPVFFAFPKLPYKSTFVFARRAIGVSAFVFSLFHLYFAFFGELGGFLGLPFLGQDYIWGVILGAISFIILSALAVTSIDQIIKNFSLKKWNFIHRFIYVAGVLILIHALILGSHFSSIASTYTKILSGAVAYLLILEALRFDNYLKKRFGFSPKTGISFMIIAILFSVSFSYLLFPKGSSSTTSPFNVHAIHIQLAKQAQQGGIGGLSSLNLANVPGAATNPGLIGDPTRRFTVSFSHPPSVLPNQDTTLDFQVFDANSGNEQDLFSFVYTKIVHLIIVDDQLTFFNHIHPVQQGSHFLITTQFPHPGRYHIYLDFQPLGAIEQQFGLTLNVGDNVQPTPSTIPPDKNLTKTFGEYTITMTPSSFPLKGSDLSIGNQTITFTLTDAKTHKPITNLKPYLAAFGHLTLINEKTYDFVHVHPSNLFPPSPNANGGPSIEFLPLGLYGPIRPGTYRLFAEFNPDNKLFTADYTVEVK